MRKLDFVPTRPVPLPSYRRLNRHDTRQGATKLRNGVSGEITNRYWRAGTTRWTDGTNEIVRKKNKLACPEYHDLVVSGSRGFQTIKVSQELDCYGTDFCKTKPDRLRAVHQLHVTVLPATCSPRTAALARIFPRLPISCYSQGPNSRCSQSWPKQARNQSFR
jgi:hypothetical protein